MGWISEEAPHQETQGLLCAELCKILDEFMSY